MLKKMMAAGVCAPKTQKCYAEVETRPSLIEPEFPQNIVKWDQNTHGCRPCKGVYTYISSPKAMHNNRKLANGITTAQYVYLIFLSICLFTYL